MFDRLRFGIGISNRCVPVWVLGRGGVIPKLTYEYSYYWCLALPLWSRWFVMGSAMVVGLGFFVSGIRLGLGNGIISRLVFGIGMWILYR